MDVSAAPRLSKHSSASPESGNSLLDLLADMRIPVEPFMQRCIDPDLRLPGEEHHLSLAGIDLQGSGRAPHLDEVKGPLHPRSHDLWVTALDQESHVICIADGEHSQLLQLPQESPNVATVPRGYESVAEHVIEPPCYRATPKPSAASHIDLKGVLSKAPSISMNTPRTELLL
ncbi:hypothetical protein PV325_010479 [Microctonus aethiopoides]|nr:hypothetical protein PV325_010479 [Microctonus aethiopoides]